MADETAKPFEIPATTESRDDKLAPQLWMMITTFWNSPGRNTLILLGVALCVVVALTAFGQIKLNAWNKPFYDALSLKDFSEFLYQLVVFGVIAGALLALNVAQAWLREMSKLKLRDGLTHDLFDQWLVPERAFRLSGAGEIGVNPDQRIHEDARHLVESLDRPRHWLAPSDASSHELYHRFMGRFGKRNIFRRRNKFRVARIYGLVCARLCWHRVLWKLADRASVD